MVDFDVSAGLAKTVQLPDKSVICEYCKTSYAASSYAATSFKHSSEYSKFSQGSNVAKVLPNDLEESNNCQSDQQFDEKTQETCDLTELNSGANSSNNNKTSNRRGANQRKSYTMSSKLKLLIFLMK